MSYMIDLKRNCCICNESEKCYINTCSLGLEFNIGCENGDCENWMWKNSNEYSFDEVDIKITPKGKKVDRLKDPRWLDVVSLKIMREYKSAEALTLKINQDHGFSL